MHSISMGYLKKSSLLIQYHRWLPNNYGMYLAIGNEKHGKNHWFPYQQMGHENQANKTKTKSQQTNLFLTKTIFRQIIGHDLQAIFNAAWPHFSSWLSAKPTNTLRYTTPMAEQLHDVVPWKASKNSRCTKQMEFEQFPQWLLYTETGRETTNTLTVV